MNIFFVDNDPVRAAQMLCDVHVNKMLLESAQMLCTTHRVLDGRRRADRDGLYKATHANHPCNVWLRQSASHYLWLWEHFRALCNEFCYRRWHAKDHKTAYLVGPLACPPDILAGSPSRFSDPPTCMPGEFVVLTHGLVDAVASYRRYYREAKRPEFVVRNMWHYTRRDRPDWLTD